MNQKLTVLLALLSIVLTVCLLQKDKPPVISSSVSEPTNKFNPDPNIVYVNELYDDSNSVFRLGMTVDEVKTQLKKYNMEWSSGFDYKLAPSAIIYAAKTGIIFHFNELSDNAIVVRIDIDAKIPTTMGLHLYNNSVDIIKIYGYGAEMDYDSRSNYFNPTVYMDRVYKYEMEEHMFIIKTDDFDRVCSWSIWSKHLWSTALASSGQLKIANELFDDPDSVFRLGMTKDEVFHQVYKYASIAYSYFDSDYNPSPRIHVLTPGANEVTLFFNEISNDAILEYIFVYSGAFTAKRLSWYADSEKIIRLYGDNVEIQKIEKLTSRESTLSPMIFSEFDVFATGYYYIYEMEDHMFILRTDMNDKVITWAIMSKDYYNNCWK